MEEKPTDRTGASRRRFLRALGGLSSLGLTIPLLSGGGSASKQPAPEEFKVSGHQIITTDIEPDRVTVHKKKISSDLARRYDVTPPILEKTETAERPNPALDDLPRRDTQTVKVPWDTYYAKEDEWKRVLKGRPQTANMLALSSGDPKESEEPYGIYEYEEVDGGYEISAPMNVISSESMDDIVDVLDSNGWTTYVVQWDRYAWNSDTQEFESSHKSAATGTFGFLGRNHGRFWEFGGYTSCCAHIDSSVPHEAKSLDDAEAKIEQIFDDESGWYGWDDCYYLDNGYMMDHDGKATGLFKY